MAFHFWKNRSQDLSWLDDRESVLFRKLQEVGSWILIAAIAVFLAAVLCFSFGYRTREPDASMEPQIATPERGDVVAICPGGDTTLQPVILRVVAIPGETVEVMDGELLVGGVPSGTAAGYDSMDDAGIAARQITLGNGEYFCLGDNRNDSLDSRNSWIGVIRESSILGRVWLCLPSGGSMHRVK